MKNKRLITENWYKFLNEMDGETSLGVMKAQEEIAQLEAMIENLEETIETYKARIEVLQREIGFDQHSALQMKEDKDG
tara:strand:- start:261 stop:494 length:234 start_codon:yes stop_codon:yes gene_type:complete